MSDLVTPENIENASDLAKVGGSGTLGAIIAFLGARFFGSQDKVIVRLDAMALTLVALSQQLAVLGAGTERRDADVSRLDTKLEAHGERVARLEAMLERRSP